jgi:hypothetical protein
MARMGCVMLREPKKAASITSAIRIKRGDGGGHQLLVGVFSYDLEVFSLNLSISEVGTIMRKAVFLPIGA